jgi:iron(III) transport system permease protein
MSVTAASLFGRGRSRTSVPHVVFLLLLLWLVLFVLYPVLAILANSFVEGEFVRGARSWSLEPWRRAVAEPGLWIAIANTVKVVLAVEAVSLPLAVVIAWLLGRTDLPARNLLEFAFWVAFFLPPLSVTVGWIALLDAERGLLNQLALFLGASAPPFDIHSYWGIVWAHLSTNAVAVKVMLLTPVFRNLDASFEEAARVSGAGRWHTFARVVMPLAFPGILTVLVLATIRAMQTFEIELVLGPPFNFWVFGTMIYRLIEHQPPQFGSATALAVMAVLVIVPLIFVHRWLLTRKDATAISGRSRLSPMPLGRWRRPAFFGICLLVAVFTALPVVFLVTATFMKLFGFFNIPDPWTLANWGKVLNDFYFARTALNTLKMSASAALISVVLCALIAYFAARSRYAGRGALDFLSWLPFAIPGILLGLGLLHVVLGNPLLRPLYGGLPLLVAAVLIAHLTLGTQILKATMVQLSAELEEAARASGASWWYSFRKIVVPILAPTLVLVAVFNFIAAARDISSIALLASSNTKTLSLLQLDYLVDGRSEQAAVVSCIVIVFTTGVAFIARAAGLKIGLQER